MEEPASKATTTKTEEPPSKAATTKTEGQGQVMTVDPNKHNQGLRLTLWNCQNKENLKAQKSKSRLVSSQYYGTGSIMAVGALGILSCYVYQSKKGNATNVTLVH